MMRRRSAREEREEREELEASESDRTTTLMCLALVAGLYVGATMARSWYRSHRLESHERSRSEQLRRWENEGGAIGSTVTTPPAA